MKLRTLSASVVAAGVLYAAITYGLPAYQAIGGTQRDPRDISLRVFWPGRNLVPISWYVASFSGKIVGQGSPIANGGVWHTDVTVPGPGVYQVILVASPAVITVRSPAGDFKKSTVTTCTVTSVSGTVTTVGPAIPGQGCKISTEVVVPSS